MARNANAIKGAAGRFRKKRDRNPPRQPGERLKSGDTARRPSGGRGARRCRTVGFGPRFERAIIYATGMANIRDVIPFPRAPKTASF